jgi:hypothetical protein
VRDFHQPIGNCRRRGRTREVEGETAAVNVKLSSSFNLFSKNAGILAL